MNNRERIAWFLLAAAVAWYLLRRKPEAHEESGAGSGGAGGAGGSAAAPPVDLSPLIAAVQALQQARNLRTVTVQAGAGTTELVAAEGSKRIYVLAYCVMGSGSIECTFTSAGIPVWRLSLEAAAGKSGANLATSLPSYLFSGETGANLAVSLSAAATVSVTYWQE